MRIFYTLLFFITFLTVNGQEDAWVYLTDKPDANASLANPITILSQKALDRRAKHNIDLDERDVPISTEYINDISLSDGVLVMAKSKWMNAVHVRGSELAIKELLELGFVDYIDFADKSLNSFSRQGKVIDKFEMDNVSTSLDYTNSSNQVDMLNGNMLHIQNYTGDGITIAVLDGGFPNVNTMQAFKRMRDMGNLKGGYDFVDRNPNVFEYSGNEHGTMVLSAISAYIEDSYKGSGPDASFYLFRTEDAGSENPVEESYWVEAAEKADSLGVDMINSSLGYTEYDNASYSYSNSDMDGKTTFITRGANIAYEKGILVVSSAGNSGDELWEIVGAPADAPGVLSIGAVDSNGDYAFFSSIGSAIQPTQKPDVMAQGLGSFVINKSNLIITSNGTSFSSPTMAGAVACLWQAMPSKTNAEIMQIVRESSSQFENPDYYMGYGIPDFDKALTLSSKAPEYQLTVNIYPNPTLGNLNVVSGVYGENITLTLYDLLGQPVYSKVKKDTTPYFNLSFLPQGVYLARIQIGAEFKMIKVLKS